MKKIIPYILILVVMLGLFGPIANVSAQAAPFQAPGSPTPQTPTPTDTPNQSTDFDCGGTWGINPFSAGCLASLSDSLWMISSKIAKLGGLFLDYFVYYSTNSSSYNNTFINKGWGAVRDVANIFFIVTLLYIAIKTVLSLDSHGSKKMISYVVIIALVINFSLFTTKVVIDASNILAKIFYNNITSVDANNKPLEAKDGGEKSISVGLISKFNPQQILKPGSPNYDAWTFIFVALFLTGITLYTAYVFFAIAVLFVARVVSLWIAMIFSPLAFISYAVPFDVPFGHKEWWDDLLKNAFLAPIFIFFLYIIVLFTDFLKTLTTYPEGTDVFQHLMSVAIPFAILMMLLMKAKGLVVKYSGKIGEAVMSGAKVIAGLAVGGVALGGAAALRGTAGSFIKGASTGDTAANRMRGSDVRIQRQRAILNAPDSTIVQRTQARKEIWRERKDQIKGNIQQGLRIQQAQDWLGTRLNQDQHNVEHATHARHSLDTAASTVAPGKKWDELNGEQRDMVRANIARADAMRGGQFGNRTWAQLSDAERRQINQQIEPLLATHTSAADTLIGNARTKQGIISNVVQSSVTGTYDARNLANIMMKEQSTGFAKIAMGLTGPIAMGMRGGFKQLGVNYGKAEGSFFKDLSSTISESLKGAKINVDLSHVAEEKKESGSKGGHH